MMCNACNYEHSVESNWLHAWEKKEDVFAKNETILKRKIKILSIFLESYIRLFQLCRVT